MKIVVLALNIIEIPEILAAFRQAMFSFSLQHSENKKKYRIIGQKKSFRSKTQKFNKVNVMTHTSFSST